MILLLLLLLLRAQVLVLVLVLVPLHHARKCRSRSRARAMLPRRWVRDQALVPGLVTMVAMMTVIATVTVTTTMRRMTAMTVTTAMTMTTWVVEASAVVVTAAAGGRLSPKRKSSFPTCEYTQLQKRKHVFPVLRCATIHTAAAASARSVDARAHRGTRRSVHSGRKTHDRNSSWGAYRTHDSYVGTRYLMLMKASSPPYFSNNCSVSWIRSPMFSFLRCP